jgi:hypothetical protein
VTAQVPEDPYSPSADALKSRIIPQRLTLPLPLPLEQVAGGPSVGLQ